MTSDQAARQQALDVQTSFAVSAPAGSGKTELLIQRILKLLGSVERPENILAITFTRKAASEMRDRILAALAEASAQTPVASDHQLKTRELADAVLARDAEVDWGLLQNPSRLRIQTIDAFCKQIANQLCLDTGFSLPPQLTDDADELYSLAAEEMLSYLDQQSAQGDSMRILAAHLDGNLDEICALLANLLSTRDGWLPLVLAKELENPDYLSERISLLVEEVLQQALEELLPYQSGLEELLDFALDFAKDNPGEASWLGDALQPELPDPTIENLSAWKALTSFLTTGGGTFRKSADKRLGFPTPKQAKDSELAAIRKQGFADFTALLSDQETLLPLLNRIRILPEADRDHNVTQVNDALLQLLPTLAAQFTVLSQDRGETDFTAVTMAALRALGDPENPTPLALRLDYRINHILVDEFQDTSHTQVRLLESLTAGWQPDDGRTLFVVGDGMQSIYSFRKADVSLFMRARQFGIGTVELRPLNLTANFRSEAQIVDWVNQTFDQVFPAQDDLVGGQVGFRHADLVQSAGADQIVTRGFDSPESEAAYIAEDIADKASNAEESIAVLVRGRTHLQAILPALREQGIRWQAQDIDPLASRMAVMDIHSLTRAISVPADRIAWLSILRTPWAGLDNADLYHLCQWRPEGANRDDWPPLWNAIQVAASIDGISQPGKQILARLQRLLGSALPDFRRKPLRNLVEQLWLELDGKSALLSEQDNQDIQDYLDLLEAVEQAGCIQDWQAFERRISALYAQPSAGSSEVNEGSEKLAPVQIMTIHKSKGLEFDHVYIPAMGRRQRSNDNPLLLWWEREFADGEDGYLLSTKPAKGEESDLYKYLKVEQNMREKHERARLLYVACTRAKKSLYLSTSLGYDSDKDQIKKPDSGSMLSLIWDLFEERFCDGYVPETENDTSAAKSLSYIRRLDPQRPLIHVSDTAIQESAEKLERPEGFSSNYVQRLVGNLLHETLMHIVRKEMPPEADLFVQEWRQQLTAFALPRDQQELAIASLQNSLTKIANDEYGRWLLDSSHEQREAELELDYLDQNGQIQRAIIDRTFVAEDTRWIVDYKSSAPSENQSESDFLARETDKYRPQLARYASLFASQASEPAQPIRTLLYFPAVGLHTEVNI